MYRLSVFIGCLSACLGSLPCAPVWGYPVEVRLTSKAHAPLADVIVMLSIPQKPMRAPAGTTAQLVQQDRIFKPKLLVIQAGTAVHFPNKDPIKHHVYSFSEPKTFQLQLYRDHSPNPITFDTPGIVALGCNIHDWMLGYIYVTDTPYYARTDAKGVATLEVPEGAYRLHYWHPLLNPKDLNFSRPIKVNQSFVVELKMDHKLLEPINPSHTDNDWGNY